LSTALQNFYSAFSDVATNPTSTASRQALLGPGAKSRQQFSERQRRTEFAQHRRQQSHLSGM